MQQKRHLLHARANVSRMPYSAYFVAAEAGKDAVIDVTTGIIEARLI